MRPEEHRREPNESPRTPLIKQATMSALEMSNVFAGNRLRSILVSLSPVKSSLLQDLILICSLVDPELRPPIRSINFEKGLDHSLSASWKRSPRTSCVCLFCHYICHLTTVLPSFLSFPPSVQLKTTPTYWMPPTRKSSWPPSKQGSPHFNSFKSFPYRHPRPQHLLITTLSKHQLQLQVQYQSRRCQKKRLPH